jgi:membrane associated rhomboid family serine protease
MIPLRDNTRLGRLPFVTFALIAANVVVYVLVTLHGWSLVTGPSEATALRYGATPYTFSHWGQHCALGLQLESGQSTLLCSGWPGVAGHVVAPTPTWLTAFTSMFMQANVLQLVWNTAFLSTFGRSVEDRLGHVPFLAFYVLSGLAALALQVALAPGSDIAALGGSGAIAGVLGAYIVLYPRGRVLALLPFAVRLAFVEQPAWLMLLVWLTVTVLLAALGLATPLGTNTAPAIYAQIGGLAFGVLLALALPSRARGPAQVSGAAA